MAGTDNTLKIGGQEWVPATKKKTVGQRIDAWVMNALVIRPTKALGRGLTAAAKSSIRRDGPLPWAPAWLAATATLPIPWAPAWWLTLSVLAHLRPIVPARVGRRPVLSDRELLLTARALAVTAWWTSTASVLPAQTRAIIGAVLLAPAAVTWWWWRRPRTQPEDFRALWDTTVVEAVPQLAGEWESWDQARGVGVLTLEDTLASDAAKLDERVEHALNQRRGTVTISAVPELTVRQVRVVLSSSPEERASRLHSWQGPTLTNGRCHLATRPDGAEDWVALRDVANGRARFGSLAGPTSCGKGGAQRIIGLEAALDRDTLLLICDGKSGAGLPYLAAGAWWYARTTTDWEDQIAALDAILTSRADRYGRAGLDSFTPGPENPHILLMIDELPQVVAAVPDAPRVLDRAAAIGGSLGISVVVAMQKADAVSWGGTTFSGKSVATNIRQNFFGGGFRWIGPSKDGQARRANGQEDDMELDPRRLPSDTGWCYIIDPGTAPAPTRTLWIPNRHDVTAKGAAAPYGTVEDWLERDTVHPALSADEADIMTPTAAEAASTATTTTAKPGGHADTTPATSTKDLVLDVLPEVGGMTRSEIHASITKRGATVSERRVSQILRELAETVPPLARSEGQQWKRAA